MKRVIVADSASNIIKLEGGVDFKSVPLKISTEEREFTDDSQLDVEDMVDYLAQCKTASKTACPGVGEWLDAFGDADEVYCVTIVSTLSGSYNSAMVAKQQYEEENPGRKVFVLDSYSAGPEMKLLVEKIRDLIIKDEHYGHICAEVTQYKAEHTGLEYCLESLKNLDNNGRVSHAVAVISGIAGIRVIGDVSAEGQLHPTDKARGSKKAISVIFNNMLKKGYNGGSVIIDHVFNVEAANELKKLIITHFSNANVRIEPVTGLCAYYAEKGGLMIGFEKNGH